MSEPTSQPVRRAAACATATPRSCSWTWEQTAKFFSVVRKGHLACATAAGPAFEGCGLLCGMRAAKGVVGKLSISAQPFGVMFETIGGAWDSPLGITGSAYVDFLAEGRRAGLLTENGRFNRAIVAENPEHFRQEENGLGFLLSPRHPNLRIGEVDVALLLQAKAAIAAGIETLLAIQNIPAGSIGRLFSSPADSDSISRFPMPLRAVCFPGFGKNRSLAVGNTSLGGAYLAMLDRSLAAEMGDLRVETIELNLDPGFEDRFLDHLSLP